MDYLTTIPSALYSIQWLQAISECNPRRPAFTEKDLPPLTTKVYLVTGGASGVGFELCKLLYSKSATVYIAGRSAANGEAAIAQIRDAYPDSKGTLKFLYIDLADLATVKPAAEEFLKREKRLDVVWHNAGVMVPEYGTKNKQGHELQMGTNVLGPWLLQHFLTPIQQATAALPDTPPDSVRVIWVGSSANMLAPYPGGINWDDINYQKTDFSGWKGALFMEGRTLMYGQSKAANTILGTEAAKRWKGTGIVSLSLNPGNLNTNLTRSTPGPGKWMLQNLFFYPAYYGAITELFAGLCPMITEREHAGKYIVPWGRFGKVREDIENKMEENGARLWEWCWGECRAFM